jgi:cell division protein FtsL
MEYDFQKTAMIGLVLQSLVFVPPLAMAGPVNVPNDFTAGTPARASEVNANFSAVETSVNDNDSRISDNANEVANIATGNATQETAITDLQAQVDGQETAVADLQTQVNGQEAPLRVFDANGVQVGGQVLSFSTKTIISPPSQHQTVQVVYESERGPIVLTVRTNGFDDTGGLNFLLPDCVGTPLVVDSGGFAIPDSDLFIRDDVVVVGTSIWIQDGPPVPKVGGGPDSRSRLDSTGTCINTLFGSPSTVFLEMVFAGDLSQFQPPFRLEPLP